MLGGEEALRRLPADSRAAMEYPSLGLDRVLWSLRWSRLARRETGHFRKSRPTIFGSAMTIDLLARLALRYNVDLRENISTASSFIARSSILARRLQTRRAGDAEARSRSFGG